MTLINCDETMVKQSPDSVVYISGSEIGLKVIIETTFANITDGCEVLGRHDLAAKKKLYNAIYMELLTLDYAELCKKVDNDETEAKQQWKNMCDDILLVYLLRLLIHHKKIPILENKTITDNYAPTKTDTIISI